MRDSAARHYRGAEGEYSLRGLAADLLTQVRGNLAANNIVIPVLQTFSVLLEADAFEPLFGDDEGLKRYLYILRRDIV